MVTLLSDCYISSHGKSAVGPVSYHYANDGQFNFSWSEGEFLIRVRHSTRDGEKDVKAGAEGGREELQSDGGEGGEGRHQNTCITSRLCGSPALQAAFLYHI